MRISYQYGTPTIYLDRARTRSFVALLIATVFAFIPVPDFYEYIHGKPMADRDTYIRMVENNQLPTDYLNFDTWLSYFTSEYLWNTSISFLVRDAGVPIGVLFSFIAALTLWRFVTIVANGAGFIYVPLLANPLIVDLAYSQLRVAVAAAILSIFRPGLVRPSLWIAACVVCMSIHTSSGLIALMLFTAHYFSKSQFRSLLILFLLGAVISALTGPLRFQLLSVIGDRRAEYESMSSSVLYMSFWVVLWMAFAATWRRTLTSFDARYSFIVLTIAAVNLPFDGYSMRWIALALPNIIIAMARFPTTPVSVLIVLYVPYLALQWGYWLSI